MVAVPRSQFFAFAFGWLSLSFVAVEVASPEGTSGVSLDDLFAEAEWESDLENLRLFAA